ncbi:MAG: LysM peptidoglycan-binding domain-containing protein [Clostridia bacterium]|nr:LysM peptidoglycan-binding domain-containing protein [Clostridia bacterium]
MIIHTVSRGESLYSIANTYGINYLFLAEQNGIMPPYMITEGQSLIILTPEKEYTVREGDSLYSVSRSFGITEKELLRNNPSLIGSEYLPVGKNLVISFTDKKRGRLSVNGYAYPSISKDTLNYALAYLTYLTPFTYEATGDGSLISIDDSDLIASAESAKVKTLLSVSTLSPSGGFSSEASDAILNSISSKNALLKEISATAANLSYDGVDMDFEYIYGRNASAYANLLGELSGIFNPDKITVVAVAPKTRADQAGVLYEGHDYRLLGYNANKVFLMTYEWGYTYGPPLAVAPINRVREVVNYALSEIPQNKIWMGVPNYGYDWTLPYVSGESRARAISNVAAINIARRYGVPIRFNETSASPYFNYTDSSGRNHEVWFEDARSILAKLDLVSEKGLSGIGIWNLMNSFPTLFTIINALYDIE